jgi:hypothetical protein
MSIMSLMYYFFSIFQKGLKNVFDEAILAALEPPEPAKKKRCSILWFRTPQKIERRSRSTFSNYTTILNFSSVSRWKFSQVIKSKIETPLRRTFFAEPS